MSLVSEEELVEMSRRAEAATAGPWSASLEGRDHTSGSDVIVTGPDETGPDLELVGGEPADWDFVAHARTDLPRLIQAVRACRAVSERGPELFAILRHDAFHAEEAAIEDTVVLKGVLVGRAAAEAEVARLNQLNADKGCHYFLNLVRWL